MKLFLRLYDYFNIRQSRLWALLAIVIAVLCTLVSRIEYKEDITDFMPFDEEYRKAMQVYQEVAAGNRIVMLFGTEDTTSTHQDYITAGVARFGEVLAEKDTAHWITDWQPQIDVTQVLDVFSFIYENLPIYLDEADYSQLDSLMSADPDFVQHKLQNDYEQIGSMSGSFVQPMIEKDPLGVGIRMASILRQYQPELQYEQYDGYVFTPDQKRCLVTISSTFGSSETNGNAKLMNLLNETLSQVKSEEKCRQLEVCFIGSPVIAVSNASQIKHDSILAVVVSAVLILALLFYAFRSFSSLLQIAMATGFGFLFALGILGIFLDTLSIIVLGIASIIIGIAVNYPLHFLCHMQEEPQPRTTLRELVTPLFIGNVTTVGAFLTLVPLDAVAVRDLGLFSALMLVGTIIFVLVFMPHIPLRPQRLISSESAQLGPDGVARLEDRLINTPLTALSLGAITILLGWYSLHTSFDSDLNHINYMTDRQREDLSYLASLQGESQGSTVFVSTSAGTSEEAICAMENLIQRVRNEGGDSLVLHARNPIDLIPSKAMQQRRYEAWRSFWSRHGYGDGLSTEFREKAERVGFSPEAFYPFESLLTEDFTPLEYEDFEPLTSTVLTGMVQKGQLVAQYYIPNYSGSSKESAHSSVSRVKEVEQLFERSLPSAESRVTEYHIFDLASLNSRVSDALSDNFNYIGLACSVIVFMFLWFSFRRIELALIAFLPMVIGWIWILGMMELFGIQFNIVNVILATFIFGQGDDYTIFITEGLIREYKEGRKILISYHRSILLSALIMLIGIGSLILSKHPAMHSLAEVTIIGMAVVVLMAWILPPMVFRWMIKYDDSLRRYLSADAH